MIQNDGETIVTTSELAHLFDTTPKTIADLAKREIIVKGKKRGSWLLHPSVAGYVRHLREQAAGRGGDIGADVRARLGAAQATLTETKAKQLAGELVEASEVEAKWTAACRSIRARVLAVADRMRDLSSHQHVKLTQELRNALTELSNG